MLYKHSFSNFPGKIGRVIDFSSNAFHGASPFTDYKGVNCDPPKKSADFELHRYFLPEKYVANSDCYL